MLFEEPTQSHISPRILEYEEMNSCSKFRWKETVFKCILWDESWTVDPQPEGPRLDGQSPALHPNSALGTLDPNPKHASAVLRANMAHALGTLDPNPKHASAVLWPSMAHVRQSTPDSDLGFQLEALQTFQVVPSSPGIISVARCLGCSLGGLASEPKLKRGVAKSQLASRSRPSGMPSVKNVQGTI